MNFNSYPYNMFNQNILSTYDQQQYEIERQRREHMEQQENIRDLVKAAHDFLKAAQKVKPEYREQAQQAVFAVLFEQMMQSQYGGTNRDYTGNRF